jgi:molecular chaperone GrpE
VAGETGDEQRASSGAPAGDGTDAVPPGDAPVSGAGAAAGGSDGCDVDGDVAEAAADVMADISELALARKERDDYLDSLRRLQADFENYKKRTLKQQTDHLERAARGLVEKLLPVLDAADLAIAHGAGDTVAPVSGLLMDTLFREGLEGISPQPGDPFDPTVHEAVAHEPGEGGKQEVAGVLRAGYRWKGALLRPAMVKVKG